MLVIPAMDILKGKVVRLYRGDYQKVKVYGDPQTILKETVIPFWSRLEENLRLNQKKRRLHLVDLEGAKTGTPRIGKVLQLIKKELPEVELEVGGGIRTLETASEFLRKGADYLVMGTALTRKDFLERLVQKIAPDKIVASADTIEGKVALRGWLEKSNLSPEEFIENLLEYGVKSFLVTSIARDGTLEGPDLALYERLKEKFENRIFLIASGGVSSLEDIKKLRGLADAVVVGKALYEGKI